jgi:S1-C subfamily serine protease
MSIALIIVTFVGVSAINAAMTGKLAHERYIYPVVRVSAGNAGGSGTIIYSRNMDGGDVYTTYVLTNHHVVSSSIRVVDEWDPNLQKKVKRERRSIVYVEIFKYKDISTPVGTTKVEADIMAYTKTEDMAILKLRLEENVPYVAILPLKENSHKYKVMDETIAVGCSLGFPPLPTVGMITRLNMQLQSLPYDMSSSQIIYGNSGGAMFNTAGELIGIPSRVAVVGWSSAITHMGLFIPANRIYDWMENEFYDFIFDPGLNMEKRLGERKAKLKADKEGDK